MNRIFLSDDFLYPQQDDYRLELDPTPSQFEEKVVDDTKFKYAIYDLKKFGK